ncbi:glycosyltransferase [Helicobacter jaachi]|uniref:glycosyltransferase n=1 Tax=Helicobacter jaachi TaxID=1677920 RepID=UPI000A75D68E|nr:glycosyltransferase [Helicobacter jaachi]
MNEKYLDSISLNTSKALPLPVLSIVVPCYNESEIITYTHEKLSQKLDSMMQQGEIDARSFICYIDDGSRDSTWEMIKGFAQDSMHIQGNTPPPRTLKLRKLRIKFTPKPLNSHAM